MHNIEPEAGALDRADVGATLERLEDAGEIRLRYADALILDGHLRLGRADGEPDRDERAGGGVAHRIAEEVGKDVLEQIGIGGEGGGVAGGVELEPVQVAVAQPDLLDGVLHERRQLERGEPDLDAVRIQAAQKEDLVEHGRHAV